MSKKSKRVKHTSRMPAQAEVSISRRLLDHAQQQMMQGDFVGTIATCEPLRHVFPKRSSMYIEVLSLLGLAHAALYHYPESYDIFTEAVTIDPTNAELWYNRGLASQCVTRVGQSVRDFERAVALARNVTGEMTRQFTQALARSRECVAEAMQEYNEQITLDKYIECEDLFMRAMQLMKNSQWREGEQIFRQLVEMRPHLPQYWGNLGVCLIMQSSYDDAEVAFKQALAIDPLYPVARDNLMKLPLVRRGGPAGVEIVNLAPEPEPEQTITFFEADADDPSLTVSKKTIELHGDAAKEIKTKMGLLPPRYCFFLNPYKNTRFTICPQCENKTRTRKFSLVIHVDPKEILLWDKICRYCYHCDLLIMHQDKLEELLLEYFMVKNPAVIGNGYAVLGTIEKSELKHAQSDVLPFQEMLEHLHDFKARVTFRQVPI